MLNFDKTFFFTCYNSNCIVSKYKSISKTCEKNYIRVEMIKETINDPMLSFSAAGIMTFILRVFVFLPGEILAWQIFHELSL